MPESPRTEPAAAVWSQQSLWSQAANRLKKRIGRWRVLALSLTSAGAVLTVLASQVASLSTLLGKTLAVVAAISVGLVPLARARPRGAGISEWTRARSVSEALKSELYTFLARVSPYREDDREKQLVKRMDELTADAADLLRYCAGLDPGSRPLPQVTDVGSYVQARLKPQIDWYRRRATQLSSRLRRVQVAEFGLSAVGVALGAVAATLAVTAASAWVAVVTTISAAVVAHAAASRYEYQLVEYLRTAAELERLLRGADQCRDPKEEDMFVQRCEEVISVQNEAWMAKWNKEEGD